MDKKFVMWYFGDISQYFVKIVFEIVLKFRIHL
jgi:hypothetical protein